MIHWRGDVTISCFFFLLRVTVTAVNGNSLVSNGSSAEGTTIPLCMSI